MQDQDKGLWAGSRKLRIISIANIARTVLFSGVCLICSAGYRVNSMAPECSCYGWPFLHLIAFDAGIPLENLSSGDLAELSTRRTFWESEAAGIQKEIEDGSCLWIDGRLLHEKTWNCFPGDRFFYKWNYLNACKNVIVVIVIYLGVSIAIKVGRSNFVVAILVSHFVLAIVLVKFVGIRETNVLDRGSIVRISRLFAGQQVFFSCETPFSFSIRRMFGLFSAGDAPPFFGLVSAGAPPQFGVAVGHVSIAGVCLDGEESGVELANALSSFRYLNSFVINGEDDHQMECLKEIMPDNIISLGIRWDGEIDFDWEILRRFESLEVLSIFPERTRFFRGGPFHIVLPTVEMNKLRELRMPDFLVEDDDLESHFGFPRLELLECRAISGGTRTQLLQKNAGLRIFTEDDQRKDEQ